MRKPRVIAKCSALGTYRSQGRRTCSLQAPEWGTRLRPHSTRCKSCSGCCLGRGRKSGRRACEGTRAGVRVRIHVAGTAAAGDGGIGGSLDSRNSCISVVSFSVAFEGSDSHHTAGRHPGFTKLTDDMDLEASKSHLKGFEERVVPEVLARLTDDRDSQTCKSPKDVPAEICAEASRDILASKAIEAFDSCVECMAVEALGVLLA